jgi:hypothetical protein
LISIARLSVGWSAGFLFGFACAVRDCLTCNPPKKVIVPDGGLLDQTLRMQKDANLCGWRVVARSMFVAALISLFSVPGLVASVGQMESGRQVIGDEPTTRLQGAEDGVQQYAVHGPEEHQ